MIKKSAPTFPAALLSGGDDKWHPKKLPPIYLVTKDLIQVLHIVKPAQLEHIWNPDLWIMLHR
jgi:hypothetical protein